MKQFVKTINLFVNRLLVGSLIFLLTINPVLAAQQNAGGTKNNSPINSRSAAGINAKQKIATNKPQAAGVDVAQLPNNLGVVLDPNNHSTDLKQASNGATVVDIATPTAKGVSQNNFSEFNVDQAGIIFNNSQGPVLTQLGGWSDGNRRLAGGPAKIILTQVTGSNRSQLLGQIEIAGQSANFILANANGISCNGCGFINTPRVSLVTGTAQYAADGSLGFNVLGGDVSIEGQGLNASNISRFDIITRAAKINAAIYANQLNIVTGKNSVDYAQDTITPLNDSTNTPIEFAIDSTALGGMYANSIRLIGTEKGVGVNTQGLVQSIGDLEISADGEIHLKNAQANNNLKIQSTSASIDNQGTLYAKNVSVNALGSISNIGLLAAEDSINLAGDFFDQRGNLYSGLKADSSLTGIGNLTANFKNGILNTNDFYVAGSAHLQLGSLDNSGAFVLQTEKNISAITHLKNTGTLQFNAIESVSLSAQAIDNQGGALSYSGNGTLTLDLQQDLQNTNGVISSHGGLNLNSSAINNQSGLIAAQATKIKTVQLNNSSGSLESTQLDLSADYLNNQLGVMTAIGANSADNISSIQLSGDLNNDQGTVYFNSASSNLSANSINNNQGLLIFANQSSAHVTVQSDINNKMGLIQSGNLSLSTQNLNNQSGEFIAANANLIATDISNDAGFLQATRWTIQANNYSSVGGVLFAVDKNFGGIALSLNQNFNQTQGALVQTQSGDFKITAKNIVNQDSAINNVGDGGLVLDSLNIQNSRGSISSLGVSALGALDLDNSSGFLTGKNISVAANTINNTAGMIKSTGENLQLISDQINNTQGVISSTGASNISVNTQFNNFEGLINSTSSLVLNTGNFNNLSGSVVSAKNLNLISTQNIENDSGQFIATETSLFTAKQFNSGSGLVSANNLQITSDQIEIAAAGTLQAEHLTLTAPNINNAGFVFSSGSASNDLSINTQSFYNQGTLEAASTDWDLENLAFTNDHGAIVHDGTGELLLGSAANAIVFDNSNSVIATKGTLKLSAQSLNNTRGTLIAAKNLDVKLTDLNNNYGVLQSGGDFNLQTENLNNANGTLVLNGSSAALLNVSNLLNNQQGNIVYGGQSLFSVNAKDLDNSSGKIVSQNDLTINTQNAVNNNLGSISAVNNLTLSTATQINQGDLVGQHLNLNIVDFTNAISASVTAGDLTLTNANKFTNLGNLNLVNTQASSQLVTVQSLVNNGLIETNNLVTELSGPEFKNAGIVSALSGKLLITADQVINDSGEISAQQITFNQKNLSNQSGKMIAGLISGSIDQLNNQKGLLQADTLNLNLINVDNTQAGKIISSGNDQSNLTAQQWLNNSGVLAVDHLALTVNQFTNQMGSVTGKQIDLHLDDLDNSAQGQIVALDSLSIAATNTLNNQLGVLQSNGLVATISAKMIENSGGSIALLGDGNLAIAANQLTHANFGNKSAEIYSKKDLQLSLAQDFTNAGSIQAENNLDLKAANFNNQLPTSSLLAQQVKLAANSVSNAGYIEASSVQIDGGSATNTGVIIASATSGQAMQFNVSGNLLNQGLLENNGNNWSLSRVDNQGTIQLIGNGLLDLAAVGNAINGKIYSNGDIKISGDVATGTFNNTGIVSAVNNLDIEIANINNQNGKLIAGKNIVVTGVALNNQAGVITSQSVADNSLAFNLTGLVNNTNNGQIESASTNWILQNIALDNTGGIINHLGFGNFTLNAQGDLKNATGKIQSNGNLFVSALGSGANVNNALGLIHGKSVQVTANNSILNTGVDKLTAGEISGANLTLTAATVDNTFGHLIANDPLAGSITFNTQNTIKNISGEISSSAQNWQLNLDQFNNTSGIISHTGTGSLQLTSASQLNNAGTISSAADLIISAAGVNNAGQLIADKNFSLNSSADVSNQSGGVISVNGNFIVNANQVNNINFINAGDIGTGGQFNLNIGQGNLTNSKFISINAANQNWSFTQFTNSGTLEHNGAGVFNLSLNQLDNTGAINSRIGSLALSVSTINNGMSGQAGVINANNFSASNFANFTNSTLSDITANNFQLNDAANITGTFTNNGIITASGTSNSLLLYVNQFNNAGTATTSSNDQHFYGALNNTGTFTHAGSGSLFLGENNLTINNSGSLASAGTAKLFNSMSGGGNIFAQTAATIDAGVNIFSNDNEIYSLGNVTILSALNNQSSGKIISENAVAMNAVVNLTNGGLIQGQTLNISVDQFKNNGGKIIAVSQLPNSFTSSIAANNLDNTNGIIKSNSNIFTLSSVSDISNTKGVIEGYGSALNLSAANSINNANGSLFSQNLLKITDTQALDNKNNLHLSQSDTKGISADTLDIQVGSLINTSGFLAALGTADSRIITTQGINNTNGKIFALSNNFTLSAATNFNNSSGELSHYGNGKLTVDAQSITTNSGSEILSNGDIDLTVHSLFDNKGDVSAYGLNNITANDLNNSGVIGSRSGTVNLNLANFTLNNSGTINGLNNLTIHAKTIANTSALESQNKIDITTASFTQVGNINSNNILNITLQNGDLTLNAGDSLKAPGSLSITLATGRGFDNSGTLSSNNDMTLNGSYLTNRVGGKILVGGNGNFIISGDVDNAGILSAQNDLTISSYNFTNHTGAEVITGGNLNFNLSNHDFINNGTIFSNKNISILSAKNITNKMLAGQAIAEIYANGNIIFNATDNILNSESRIEAGGNLELSAGISIANRSTDPNTQITYPFFQVNRNGFSIYESYYNEVDKFANTIDEVSLVQLGNPVTVATLYAGNNLSLNGGSTATITNHYGEMVAGNSISFTGNSWVNESVALGTSTERLHLGGTAGPCDPNQLANGCITTVAYYVSGVSEFFPGTSNLLGYVHAGSGNIIASFVNSVTIANNSQNGSSSIVSKTPTNETGNAASGNNGTAAVLDGSAAVVVNSNQGLQENTTGKNYNGATVGWNDLNAGASSGGKQNAASTDETADSKNGNSTQIINYVGALDANQIHTLAQSGALEKLLEQLNGGSLTQQQLLDLISQIRSGKNPFTTDQALQDFLNSVNNWFAANLSDADKAALIAINDLNSVAAKAKPQVGNTQAPSLIQIDILPYGFNLNNLSGLFVINNAPDAEFLIETRPEFTQYTNFLGSDYLLQQLGLDPSKTEKRLGDAFYENQLIQDALMRDLSLRYLDGALDDYSMMQMLMDSATNENKSLHLTVGVELTPEQCAHLTEDMLWLVEKTVKGQKVLVPHLYLTSVSKDKLEASTSALAANGAIELTAKNSIANNGKIVANSLLMSTQGSLNQNGTLIAHGDIRLLADQNIRNIGKISGGNVTLLAKADVTNTGTVVAADNLQIMSTEDSVINTKNAQLKAGATLSVAAKNDIKNQQGKIEGNDVSLFAKTGDIIFEAPAAGKQTPPQPSPSKGEGANPLVLSQGEGANLLPLSEGEAGWGLIAHHDLQMDAGHNVELQATNIKADNNISIHAANDINLTALENKTSTASKSKGKKSSTEIITHEVGSLEATNGNIIVDAGHDINLQGTKIKAVGDISIAAANDLNFNAVEDKQHSESISKNKKVIDDQVTHQLVNIESTDGNIQLKAGNDANLTGTNLDAKQNVLINADRDTNIGAVVDSTYHYDQTKKKSGGVLTSKTKTTTNETLKESAVGGVISGDNVLINAHVNDEGDVIGDKSGNVNLLGANITAKSNLIISADEDVNASGIQTQETDFHRVQKSGSFGLSKRDSGSVEKNTNLTNVNLAAQQNVILLADNIKLVGTNVTATNGNINMEAVDQLLVSAGEISQSAQNWNNKSGVFTGGKIYSKHEHKDGITETSTQASNIQAGGIVTANAGAIKIEGSNIAGDKGVGLSADAGDIEITAATTHSEAYTHDKDLTVGMGDIGKNLSRPDKWVKNENGRATVKFADAQYADVDEKTTVTGSQASNIESAEGNIIANATAGKITIAGSNVTAGPSSASMPPGHTVLPEHKQGTVDLIGANGVDITTVSEAMDKEKKSTVGSAEMSVVVQHQAVEVVVAVLNLDKARKKLEDAKKDYKDYERNLDGLQTQLKTLEADYAAKTPGVNYDDIIELRQLIGDTKGDGSFYKAGIALAALNVTTSAITLAQQIATAAASTGTYGFNAGVQLDLDATKSKTETHDTFETGSSITAKNILIQTGKLNADEKTYDAKNTTTNIHGSKINATDSVVINTGELNVTAGEATHESSTETQHGHITAQVTVYGAAGGASVSGSFDRSKNSDRSNTYNNSEITADKINITTTDDANFRGAAVRADSELNLDVGGNLNVESVQNRTSSRSTSAGISGGMSFSGEASTKTDHTHGLGDVKDASGINGGINVSNGRSSTKETVLTSLTSGGTANINVKGHTQLTGAEIATTDKEGNDLGNLNFTTGSFDFTDLKNTNYSSNTSVGVSSNFGISGGQKDPTTESTTPTGKTLKASTSNLTLSNSQTNDASKTLATLGHGNISVGGVQLEQNGVLTDAGNANNLLTSLNRDTTKIDKSLWSSSTKQSVDVTLDHRVLSEDGRNEIKTDLERDKILANSIYDVTKDSVSLFGSNGTTSVIEQNKEQQSVLTGLLNTRKSNAEALDKVADGDATAKDRESGYNSINKNISDVAGVDQVDTHIVVQENNNLNTRIDSETGQPTLIEGAFSANFVNDDGSHPNAENNIFLVDSALTDTQKIAETQGHEYDHNYQLSLNRNGNGVGSQFAEEHADLIRKSYANSLDFVLSLDGKGLGDTNTHNGINSNSAYVQNNINYFNQQDPNAMDYRQLSTIEKNLILINAPAYAIDHGISNAQAVKALTDRANARVDTDYANNPENASADQWLDAMSHGILKDPKNGAYDVQLFNATDEQKNDHSLFANQATSITLQQADSDHYTTRFILKDVQSLDPQKTLSNVEGVARADLSTIAFENNNYGKNDVVFGQTEGWPWDQSFVPTKPQYYGIVKNGDPLAIKNGVYDSTDYRLLNQFTPVVTGDTASLAEYFGLSPERIKHSANSWLNDGQQEVFNAAVRYRSGLSSTPDLVLGDQTETPNARNNAVSQSLGSNGTVKENEIVNMELANQQPGQLVNLSPFLDINSKRAEENNQNFLTDPSKSLLRTINSPESSTLTSFGAFALYVPTSIAESIGHNWEMTFTDTTAPSGMRSEAALGVTMDMTAILAAAPDLYNITKKIPIAIGKLGTENETTSVIKFEQTGESDFYQGVNSSAVSVIEKNVNHDPVIIFDNPNKIMGPFYVDGVDFKSTQNPITDPSRLLANPARDPITGKIDPNYMAPEHPDFPIVSYLVPDEGMRVNMAINLNQIDSATGQVGLNRLGGFTTRDAITSVEQVHTDLAIKTPDWGAPKNYSQVIDLKGGTRVQESIIGPQVGADGTIYNGGANQVEPLVTKVQRADVMTPFDPAQALPATKVVEPKINLNDIAPEANQLNLNGVYDPISIRKDLEAVYGSENVTSTTVPKNALQRVNSDPLKNVEVIIGDDGSKAVIVGYSDPKTATDMVANIPYNNRGLPVFDDVAKFTTDIDMTKSYDAQMRQATRDLRQAIGDGKVNPSQFTQEQLADINSGNKKIEGYTWHHNADSNSMQLIPQKVHDDVSHVGQASLSDGK